MRVHREWLQKHPTPAHADGDFHWWPAEADASVRATIAAEARGDATLWLAVDRVIVARRFGDVAPADGRRYQGLAVVLAEGAPTPALLAALELPEAAPWPSASVPRADAEVRPEPGQVAALWRGGEVGALGLAEAAAIEAWLPAEIRATPRRVVIGEGESELGSLEAVARWLAGAAAARGAARSRAERAWRAVQALARVEGRDVAAQVAALAALDDAWSTSAGVRAYLAEAGVDLVPRLHVVGDGRDQWARALHGWGRGWLDGRTEDLAAVLARCGVADRLRGAPSRRWQRILRREALMPAARAGILERAALARLPELAEDADG